MILKRRQLRSLIEGMLNEETVRTAKGKTYSGSRNEIQRALIDYGASAPERAAILAGTIPISKSALAALLRAKAVKSDAPERLTKPYDWDKEQRVKARKAHAAEKKLHAAINRFARDWRDFTLDNPETPPSDAAGDAALGFFWQYPKWKQWAKAMAHGGSAMSKEDIRALVAEIVYEEMMKGTKK